MNCNDCQELLPGLDRAELSAALHAELGAHLRACEACARAHAALRELASLLDNEAIPSPALRAQVLARLQHEAGTRKVLTAVPAPRWSSWFAALWPSRPLGAFSYSLALVLCGVFSGQLLPPGSLGVGTNPDTAAIPAERLVQLCAVPDQNVNDIL